jgi:two-component system, chemotaxis family, protein-glutamate methylesterase/glutaminase
LLSGSDGAKITLLYQAGASGAEGLLDLQELLSRLAPPLSAIVLVVLHRPWDRLSDLQSVLARSTELPIVNAAQGERFESGTVYIGEPAHHLTLAAASFGKLTSDPIRQYHNRTVDLLFHSLAEYGGNRIVGVVLSGSLDDGSRGLAAIHHAGGLTMVISSSSGNRGMPENAISYDGPVDVIGDAQHIAAAIRRAIRGGRNGNGPV